MARFWNLVLTINSVLIVGASVFLIYSFGMMVIEFEWQRFVLALIIVAVLAILELAFTALLHD